MTYTPEVYREPRGGLFREVWRFGTTSGLGREDWVELFLLARARKGLVHGGKLAAELGKMGFDGGLRGEVRAAIRKAEGEGMLVSSSGASHDGTDGDYYSITELGEAYLESYASSLERYRKEADLFLKVYAGRRAGSYL